MFDMRGLGLILILFLILGITGTVYVLYLAVTLFMTGTISTFGIISGLLATLVAIPCLRYLYCFAFRTF